MSARNTTALSENGQITAAAKGDVNLENGYNESRDDYGLKYKERGLLLSKTTTIKSRDESKTVTASTLSGDAVQITAGGNTNMTGSQVIGTHDVAISSGKDTSISSAEEYERHDYAKQVKKSGLLSGGGLGFTIGTEKRKDQYSDADLLQKSSTVGSVSGNVSIESGNKTEIGASAVLAGKDISITGENVQISSKDNVYHSEEKHEYKKSGLTVSATGGAVAVLSDALVYAQKASSARDKQLKALYGAEVYQTIAKGKDVLKDLSGKGMPGVSVGIGSSSFKAENHAKSTEAMASILIANENVKVQAKSDISMKGSQASGHTISFHAGGSIMLDAAEDRSTTDTVQSSKSSQMGMNFMPTGNNVFAENSKGTGTEAEIITTHTGSQLTAEEKISMESGKDTALRGSRVSAGQVSVQAGGNLSIESLQDTDTYRSQSHNTGSNFSTGTSRATAHHGKWMTGKSEENTDSQYESVTEQAGIHAGANGYDITVKGNTNLTGGLIDSTAAKEKNNLTTGTLSWSDVQNKAGYSMATNGRLYGADWTPTKTIQTKQGEKTTGGIHMHNSPIHAQPAKGQAETITQSALIDGAVSITDQAHQKQDISTLNRDTETSLHQLEKIFDKKKIQERRELVSEFAKLGAEKIGDIAKEKNWAEDDYRRTLLHGLLGALTAQMSGNSALAGGAAGAATERLQPVLDKLLKDYPELREDAGSVIGYAVGKALNDGKTGEAVAWNGTKFNWLSHEQKEEKERLIAEAEERGDEKTVQSIRDYYDQLDQEQDAFIASANLSEDEEYSDETEHAIITGTKTLRDLRSKDNGHVVVVEALRLAKSRGLTNYNFGDEDFVSLNGSLGLDLGISGGFIMDRRGNVYYSTGTGMVFGASAGVTTGKFKADTSNWKNSDYKEAITGISGSFGFSGIFLSGAVSIGTKYGDREIGIASGAGLSASGIVNYTEFICNINDL
ncbi:putative hemagglutinin-related protein [Dialister sp. CAG:486]|nr:putative hemagglutinin-related protein [Dialister sp. CAG:486]